MPAHPCNQAQRGLLMASCFWSEVPKLSFGSCSSLIKPSCLCLNMGHPYLVSLGGSRSSEADLGRALLPSAEEEKPATTAHKKEISQRGHRTIIILEAIRNAHNISESQGTSQHTDVGNCLNIPRISLQDEYWGQRSTDKSWAMQCSLGTCQHYRKYYVTVFI